MIAYSMMFGSALLAATVLPFYSEVVLLAYISQGYSASWMWLAATIGNTLGSVVNWVLGRYLLRFSDRKWFPFKPASLNKTQAFFQKYGTWTLLFSWAPLGGDALPFVAGVMKVRLLVVVILCGIGKGLRYFVLIQLIE